MKRISGESNRLFRLCVDSYEEGVPEGRLFHPNLENGGFRFRSLTQLVLKIEELLVFLENLECDTFYDGVHYLNPLNYRLRVRDAEAKAAVLADIREALSSHSDEELELMVSRERMKSL